MPVKYKAGPKMLWSVAAYGLSILTFGLSQNIYLSVFALFCVGASDQISVFIRHTIVQTDTPDTMRGRVSAVNVIFVGASGSLGEFESGALASLIGVIPAVAFGGAAAIVCAGLWALMFKSLRERDALIPAQLAGDQK
jgi:MFS family permease